MINLVAGSALIVAATALGFPPPALAQSAAEAKVPSVLDPRAPVPPLQYRSAFSDYKPNAEAKVGAWRELNDTVGRIGGWRVYAREAREPVAAPSDKKSD